MSTVRTVVQPGWLAVSGPEVDAVVEAADRHADSLEAAAADGLVALLEALTAHGLSGTPALAACAPTPTGFRLVLRGDAVVVLPDGTRVGAQGRMPWLDVDLDLDVAEDGEVVLEAPEPEQPRGWRRPARLSRPAAEPELGPEAEGASEPEPDPEAERQPEPGPEADLESEPEPRGEAEPDHEPEPVVAAAPHPDLTLPPPDDASGLPPVARVPPSPAPRSGLIDAVPWRRADRGEAPSADDATPPVPPVPVPTPTELLPVIDPDIPFDLEPVTHAVSPSAG